MKWLLRAALWSAFGHAVIVACSDAAVLQPRDEGDDYGTGGSDDRVIIPASGGRSNGDGKTSPPQPTPAGGRFGAGGSPFPGAGGSPIPKPDPCGPVVWTPQAYCSTYPGSCHLSSQACLSNQISTKQSVEQGCGYIRFTYHEDSGNHYGRVYDQSTGLLVHYYVASFDMECGNVTEVGLMPGCFRWAGIPCGSWLSQDAGISDASTD
jgi:hypothetical protein